MKGLLCKAIAGFYYVHAENNVYECKARGNFRKEGITPLVGDLVEITVDNNNKGVIEYVYPRKNSLVRPAVANIDKLFIVSSYTTPSPNLFIIDRLSALCIFHNIKPVIVFNKCDLGDFTEYKNIYEKSGFTTAVVSAQSGEGIDALKEELKGCVSAFTGNSGVGKSSLLNILFPTLNLQTGEVSDKLGRGKHTTRHTELFAHCFDGYVADTPGFSSLDSQLGTIKFKEKLVQCFPDFTDFTYECKFLDCAHIGEKGCGVCKAVQDGKIEKSRHESYCALYNELKDLKSWEISKKR
ncbi:MAG: ribosome small subunit-dependent GTPase A [Acutalibacteraceae bacterium]|nr:ribosome small subunit-dependent GTPase A [Acutalibacteraceae bacterium]